MFDPCMHPKKMTRLAYNFPLRDFQKALSVALIDTRITNILHPMDHRKQLEWPIDSI